MSVMNYKPNHLILAGDDARSVYENKIRPYLNKHESFYQIFDMETMTCVAYAYRCTRIELYVDLAHYATMSGKRNGTIDFIIHVYGLWSDGVKHLIAMEEF